MVSGSTLGPAAVATDKSMTEIEQHGAQLADTARRLNIAANKLESRIDQFMQSPSSISVEKTPEGTSPTPGTLGCLRHFHAEIDCHTTRIEDALSRLAGII